MEVGEGGVTVKAAAAIVRNVEWREALAEVAAQIGQLTSEGTTVDVAFLFASSDYAAEFPFLVSEARKATGARVLVGCSGQGIIGPNRELEGVPAVSLLVLSLPGAALYPVRITQEDLEQSQGPSDWERRLGVGHEDVNAWFLFADPFTLDPEHLLAALSQAYPTTPVVGGLASGDFRLRRTHVFLNESAYEDGAVAVALGGAYAVRAVVSQGCAPIGDTWTITGAQGHIIQTIGQRPAYHVLVDTIRALPPELQWRAQRNIFIGLAMDEYRDEFRRGDFLVRNLLGADPESGALAVGAVPRVGQTLQFQLRDPTAADEDLRELLTRAKGELGREQPLAALLCSCNGRGVGLFGQPNHDAGTVAEELGPIPLAGFFCNGEFGPVGARNFLHGYTVSIALIVPK